MTHVNFTEPDPAEPDIVTSASRRAVDAGSRAWTRAYPVILLIPAVLAFVCGALMLKNAFVAPRDLSGGVQWIAIVYLALLTVGIFVYLTPSLAQTRTPGAGDCACQHQPPAAQSAREGLTSLESWRLPACTAPAAVLCGVHLAAHGEPHLFAVGAGILGWLGTDIGMTLANPARLRLLRALSPVGSTPRNTPDL